MTLPQYAFAGFFSAIPMTIITAPFERIKIVLQIQGQQSSGEPKYKGGFDAMRGIYKEGGLRSGMSRYPLIRVILKPDCYLFVKLIKVFRGSAATLARDGPGSAAYFAVYEYVKRKLTPEGHTLSLPAVIMAGGLAGKNNPNEYIL
jgi:solute carrier family 25 (mitochondrial carnitine/acylcarnitine transporter), member 20/29